MCADYEYNLYTTVLKRTIITGLYFAKNFYIIRKMKTIIKSRYITQVINEGLEQERSQD